MFERLHSHAGRALSALVWLGALAVPSPAATAQLDPEDIMAQEFQFFCLNYYTSAECTGAVRFIIRTAGGQYFVGLQYDMSNEGFLDQLAAAIKGGEAVKVSETPAAKIGDLAAAPH
jgi:hypothetical protein